MKKILKLLWKYKKQVIFILAGIGITIVLFFTTKQIIIWLAPVLGILGIIVEKTTEDKTKKLKEEKHNGEKIINDSNYNDYNDNGTIKSRKKRRKN